MSNFITQINIEDKTTHEIAQLLLERPNLPIKFLTVELIELSEFTSDYDTVERKVKHLNQYDDHIEIFTDLT